MLSRFAALFLLCASSFFAAASDYALEPAFGKVRFEEPVQLVFAPGETERAFVVERGGVIAVIRDRAAPKREVFMSLGPLGKMRDSAHGTMSLAFHPQFASNRFLYLWFSVYLKGERAIRLSRFTASNAEPLLGVVQSEYPLLTQVTARGGHDGGQLLFGPDGYLYLAIGDGDKDHDDESHLGHQRIDRNFFGAVLRLDVDKKPGSLPPNPHRSVRPGSYTIPPDNPFVAATSFNGAPVDPANVRTEFWAVGFRNPWRIAFDPATGRLWCGDVGLDAREEVDVIVAGGNYGWDFREGHLAGPRRRAPALSSSNGSADAKFVEPVWDYNHRTGLSITGGFVYHGKNFPELEGCYLFADYVYGKVWALQPDGDKPVGPDRVRQIATVPSVVALTPDPRNGDPLLTSFTAGQIWRIVRQK